MDSFSASDNSFGALTISQKTLVTADNVGFKSMEKSQNQYINSVIRLLFNINPDIPRQLEAEFK